MAENYQSKRERWKRLRENFPTPLENIALSSVDAIAGLEEPARLRLANLLPQLESVPKAILLLDIFPDMGEEDLLMLVNAKGTMSWREIQVPAKTKAFLPQPNLHPAPEDILSLADTLQSFYPQMPRTAAEALASSNTMKETLHVVKAVRIAREKTNSDFVTLCLYGLFKKTKKELVADIKANPSFLNAARQSHLWDE